PVLRRRVRVHDVQLERHLARDPGRSPFLHVFYACRAGELLAIQRRPERCAALMPGTILVTGAAGFAGSHLIESLAGEEATVVAWHRPGGRPPREVAQTVWRAVDLLDSDAVRRAIDDIQPAIVYHFAGATHVGRSWDQVEPTLAINVRGTHVLLQALAR